MRDYTVKEIVAMLDTNPETVTRWIRAGKLKSKEQNSRKAGNIITAQMLNDFLSSAPKYAAIAATAVSPITSIPILLTALIGGLRMQQYANSKEEGIDTTEIAHLLKTELLVKQKTITRKENEIFRLQGEIREEKTAIAVIQQLMQELEDQKSKI